MMFPIRLALVLGRGMLAGMFVFLAGWLQAVPPDAAERRALAMAPGEIRATDRAAVRNLRLARVALWVAPDLAVDMIARQGQGRVSRDEIATALNAMANGSATPPDRQTTETLRRISGAKFLSAPTAGG